MSEPEKENKEPESSLDNLQDQLYATDVSEELTERSEDVAQLGLRKKEVKTPGPVKADLSGIIKKQAQKRRRIFLTIGAVVGIILLIVGATVATWFYRQTRNVKPEQMVLNIEAPEVLTSGQQFQYAVNLKNDSTVDWQNVKLSLDLPDGFTGDEQTQFQFEELASGEAQQVTVSGRVLGELNTTVTLQAIMEITPENFPGSSFEKTATSTSTITAVPIDLAVLSTQQAASGQNVLVNIKVTNTSDIAAEKLKVELAPATGILLATDDPEFSPGYSVLDKSWTLENLEPRESQELQAVIVPQGSPGDNKALTVSVSLVQGQDTYLQRQAQTNITIAKSELSLTQEYLGTTSTAVARTGQQIEGKITYQNTGSKDLSDVVITAELIGDALDASSLDLPTGSYNPATSTIIWTAASVPELKVLSAGESGELTYKFAINDLSDFPDEEDDVNQALIINTTIDSPDVTIPTGEDTRSVSDRFVLSIASDLLLSVDSFYDDGRLGIESTGPLPPEVGQTTSYTVRARFGSALNDVGNVRLTAILPEGVTYTGKNVVTSGELTFNDRTGEMVWQLPLLSGQTGRSKPFVELNFQVAITPGEDKRGDDILLLKSMDVAAQDLFTETELTSSLSSLPDTESAAKGQGEVQ